MTETLDFVGQVAERLSQFKDVRPLYRKLADAMAEQMPVDAEQAHLPSERQLSSDLGLSRVTVRRALDELAADGLLIRRQGARTVTAKRMEKALSALTGFSDELRARGQSPGQRWISREKVMPTPAEAMALDLAGNDPIIRLVRVRLADGVPIALERAAVPQSILPSGSLVKDSLYDALGQLEAQPVRGVQRIRAGIMTRADAERLESNPGGPLLIVERRCFLRSGKPVEFTETRYNGESYDFLTELKTE